MAWKNPIDTQLFTMFKPEHPLVAHGHLDSHPWWQRQTEIVDMYHSPFAIDDPHAHEQNRFPDVEDAGWDMGLVSPPSPSRRGMDTLQEFEDIDMDDPPTLSPPSPSRRSLALLPDTDTDWQLHFSDTDTDMDDCPQLSPPSPIHCKAPLPALDCDFDTHPLFIEDATTPTHTATTSPTLYTHSGPPSPSPLACADRLHAEHMALMSLRDRTIHAERTSRARNVALRGRERELGRAVAALRDAHVQTQGGPPVPDPILELLGTYPVKTSGDRPLDGTTTRSLPTPTEALHAYRTLATTVMLERIEEKRRRKRDKECLKELRIILGVGVHALLYFAGDTEAYKLLDARFPFRREDLDHMAALDPPPIPSSVQASSLGLGRQPPQLLISPSVVLHPPESEPFQAPLTEHELSHQSPHMPTSDPIPALTFTSESSPDSHVGLGLGLGLGLEFSPASPTLSTSPTTCTSSCMSPHMALAERTLAMRKLVARMTMRRRDLGMRSLVEAGNMSMSGADGAGGVGEWDGTQKRKTGQSALGRKVISAD